MYRSFEDGRKMKFQFCSGDWGREDEARDVTPRRPTPPRAQSSLAASRPRSGFLLADMSAPWTALSDTWFPQFRPRHAVTASLERSHSAPAPARPALGLPSRGLSRASASSVPANGLQFPFQESQPPVSLLARRRVVSCYSNRTANGTIFKTFFVNRGGAMLGGFVP